MEKNPINILAVNPGSRYLGFAVFQGTELIDWGIKNIRGDRLKNKIAMVQKALSDLIDRYAPDSLMIKKLHSSRTSSGLNKLVDEIKKLGRQKKLKIHQYTIEDIESSFSGDDGKINKTQMAELVVQQYPFLFNELEKETANFNPYHIRMFEAVALGLVCFHRIKNKP